MVKALLGYDLPPGLAESEHLAWLKEIHFKGMDQVPGLEGIVLNRTEWVIAGDDAPAFVAELHYPDKEAYLRAREWLKEHPFPPQARPGGCPQGRMLIRFFIICASQEMNYS